MVHLRRFLSPYYLINGALMASYALVRLRYKAGEEHKYSRLKHDKDLDGQEVQVASLLTLLLLLKWWKRLSLDAWIQEALFYSKVRLGPEPPRAVRLPAR